MPSGPNYKRNYEEERKAEPDVRKRYRSLRNKARAAFEQELGRELSPNQDVDHIDPLSKGGSNNLSNLRAVPKGRNRSFPRTRKGKMK